MFSLTMTPVAVLGPLFLTRTQYVIRSPTRALVQETFLKMVKSTTGFTVTFDEVDGTSVVFSLQFT